MAIAIQQKGIRQPLGTMQNVNRVISGVPPNLALEETRNLKIIYAKRKLQVDIPLKWTINKVKCMMCTHFQILQFDKFQFQCDKLLIPGKTLVKNLPGDELIVTKAECPKAFQKFYSKTIKKTIKKYNINTQSTLLPILGKDFAHAMSYKIPRGRRKNIEAIPQNRNAVQQNEEGAVVMNILRVVGLGFMANIVFSFASYWQIGVLIFIILLYYAIDEYVNVNERRRVRARLEAEKKQQEDKKKEDENKKKAEQKKELEPEQKAVNSMVREQKSVNENILINEVEPFPGERKASQMSDESNGQGYFNLRKESQEINDRKYSEGNESVASAYEEQQTKKQSEQLRTAEIVQKPQRRTFRAKLRLWMAFIAEFVYCYVLSIFPNWTVETHLHANQQAMDQVMNEVKQLDPEVSEQVKKWEIKPKTQSNQVELKQDKEEKQDAEEQKQDQIINQ